MSSSSSGFQAYYFCAVPCIWMHPFALSAPVLAPCILDWELIIATYRYRRGTYPKSKHLTRLIPLMHAPVWGGSTPLLSSTTLDGSDVFSKLKWKSLAMRNRRTKKWKKENWKLYIKEGKRNDSLKISKGIRVAGSGWWLEGRQPGQFAVIGSSHQAS